MEEISESGAREESIKKFVIKQLLIQLFRFIPFGILSPIITMFHFSLEAVSAIACLSRSGCD